MIGFVNRIRSKNLIAVLPNTKYVANCVGDIKNINVLAYGKDTAYKGENAQCLYRGRRDGGVQG